MSAPELSPATVPLRQERCHGQAGFSLIEVLLVVAISALIMVPLMAWAGLAIRQQPITRDGMVRTADTGLLGEYLPKDIAIAGDAAVSEVPAVPAVPATSTAPEIPAIPAIPATPTPTSVGLTLEDCIGGSGEVSGDVVLALLSRTDTNVKTVYTEAPMVTNGVADPERVSVWRRVCGELGPVTSVTEVVEDVVRGSTVAKCNPVDPNDLEATCRQVAFRTQASSGGREVLLSGTRRADTASLRFDSTGNRLPVAKINPVSQTSNTVVLSASGSKDPDGNIVSYDWVIPTQPEGSPGGTAPESVSTATADVQLTRSLPSIGRYHVTLTVTDDKGAKNTTRRRVTVEPLAPDAVASISPEVSTVGDVVSFTGSGSTDPDSSIVSYRWVLGGDEAAAGVSYVVDQADWQLSFPEFVTGRVAVTLTVTDDQGRSDTSVSSFTVNPPGPPPPGPEPGPGDPLPEGPPPVTVPGGPTAVIAATQDSDQSRWAFDASGTTAPAGVASYRWDFGLPGATAQGIAASYRYPSPGTYTVVLTVTDADGRVGSVTRQVNSPGAPGAPAAPSQSGPVLAWAPVAGARRYLVDFEFVSNGCARTLVDQVVAPGANPGKAIPPSLCAGSSTARARYAVEVNGQRAYSPWINVTTPTEAVVTGPGEVVK